MRAPLSYLLNAAGLLALACNSATSPFVPFPLPTPTSLTSVSLNQMVQLSWADNAFAADPNRFSLYRVYSTSYNLDTGLCGTVWSVEGTTVAPDFLVSALTNGVPRCYGVTALTRDGTESARSAARQDTPRPDARNVLVHAYVADSAHSGFRFWDDFNGSGTAQANELGLIQSGNLTSIDFVVDRGADLNLWIIPVYTGTSMRQYGSGPIADLTSIDFAPATGYSADSLVARVGNGYVFEMVENSVLHYGAIRVSFVGSDYLILDWSFQTDQGNPELVARGSTVAATH
jgi:hypothetical protein